MPPCVAADHPPLPRSPRPPTRVTHTSAVATRRGAHAHARACAAATTTRRGGCVWLGQVAHGDTPAKPTEGSHHTHGTTSACAAALRRLGCGQPALRWAAQARHHQARWYGPSRMVWPPPARNGDGPGTRSPRPRRGGAAHQRKPHARRLRRAVATRRAPTGNPRIARPLPPQHNIGRRPMRGRPAEHGRRNAGLTVCATAADQRMCVALHRHARAAKRDTEARR